MKRMKAFTLIELLVVISIIALLISILLPAIGAARAQAVFIACGSAQRQLGTAFHNYLTEHDGYQPSQIYAYDAAGYGQYAAGAKLNGYHIKDGYLITMHHLLVPYMGAYEGFMDPATQNVVSSMSFSSPGDSGWFANPMDRWPAGEGPVALRHMGYGFNQDVTARDRDATAAVDWVKLDNEMVSPSATYLAVDAGVSRFTNNVFEEFSGSWYYYVPGADTSGNLAAKNRPIHPRAYAEAVNGRHPSKSVNFLFGDGHVESRQANVLNARLLDPGDPFSTADIFFKGK